jgi:hypothetical protein
LLGEQGVYLGYRPVSIKRRIKDVELSVAPPALGRAAECWIAAVSDDPPYPPLERFARKSINRVDEFEVAGLPYFGGHQV